MKKRRARAETKEEIEEGGGAAVSLPATASRACVGQWSSTSSPGAPAGSNVSGGGGSNGNGRKEMDRAGEFFFGMQRHQIHSLNCLKFYLDRD